MPLRLLLVLQFVFPIYFMVRNEMQLHSLTKLLL